MNTEQLYSRMKKSHAVYLGHLSEFMRHIRTETETVASAGINARPKIAVIQDVICQAYTLDASAMITQSRPQHIARPRQTAMVLCRQLTTYSLEEIGRCFGGRDHGTVMNAEKGVKNRLEMEEGFRKEFEAIREACRDRIDKMKMPLFANRIQHPAKPSQE